MFNQKFLNDAIARGADVLRVVANPFDPGIVEDNYLATLATPIEFDEPDLVAALDLDYDVLLSVHPEGVARFWGSTEKNRSRIGGAKPGDVVIFCGDGRVWGIGEIGVRFDSPEFSEQIWSDEGEIFPVVYTILNFEDGLTIPLSRSNHSDVNKKDAPGRRPSYLAGPKASHVLGELLAEARMLKKVGDPMAAKAVQGVAPASRQPRIGQGGGRRIIRNTKVTEYVKSLYADKCQFCGTILATKEGTYSEAAHIRGVGAPHNGADGPENVLCLCPNDHVMFDRGALYVAGGAVYTTADRKKKSKLFVNKHHGIDVSHFDYHREYVAEVVDE